MTARLGGFQAPSDRTTQSLNKEGVSMKLAHARIVTNDVPGLTRFYQQVTGMAPVGDDRYVEFNAPALTLAISSQRMIDVHSAGAATPRANRSVILDFEVDDVDEERARLENIVSEFVLEPVTQPWGNRAMLFRDPDGNLINMFAAAPPPKA
jgi:catechol 2,3-dioxygenase-like lactoylglutathione lyase family enzyme